MWNEIKELQSKDTDVKKYIFTKEDAIAESVLYKYNSYEERTVMCISTQTGCPMGCVFCGTGKFFGRDLTSDEILSQVYHMVETNNISMAEVNKLQIMVMSMGEPLLNINNLSVAFKELNIKYPNAALLVSTSAPRTNMWSSFMLLAEEIDNIGLQFSVHASTDDARNKLMPMKAKLSLAQISDKGHEFFYRTGRKPFFNYCVTDHNNSQEDAQRLFHLFDPEIFEATLSVVCETDQNMSDAVQSQRNKVAEFSSKLLELGFNTRVFDPAGQDDIGAGCGMLWETQKFVKENPQAFKMSTGYKIKVRNVES